MNSQNTYTFTKRNLQKNDYDKIFEYVHTHRNDSWKRLDLLYLSGYISDQTYDNLVRNPRTITGSYSWSNDYSYRTDGAKNGYLCYITGRMRELGILSYDKHTKRWSAGPNFDHYYYLNTKKETPKKEMKSSKSHESSKSSESKRDFDLNDLVVIPILLII